jgi:DNA mismatch endonuclease, patch repair protein
MSKARRRDTKPELDLRHILHARGMRYRVNFPVPNMPRRTIDVAFPRARLAVFVDGCFWHNCPVHGSLPRSNTDWWGTKFEVNLRRDQDTDDCLARTGWTPLRFWEHGNPTSMADVVQDVLRTNRQCVDNNLTQDEIVASGLR